MRPMRPGIWQTGMRPGLAAVHGLVDAVAVVGRSRVVRFTGADVDHVGTALRERHRAEREVGLASKTGVKLTPLLTVFQSPPVAVAA